MNRILSRLALSALAATALTTPALAHDGALPHAHPHLETLGGDALLVAAVLALAVAGLVALAGGRVK